MVIYTGNRRNQQNQVKMIQNICLDYVLNELRFSDIDENIMFLSIGIPELRFEIGINFVVSS